MMKFLLKGILRDRSRSLFPFLTVTAGVFLTVILFCYIKGMEIDVVRSNANLSHGHVKLMTRAYSREIEQLPNDLALTGVDSLIGDLRKDYPGFVWVPRIQFGGLLDVPDERGETKAQAPVAGLAADLRSVASPEREFLGLEKTIVRGRLPQAPGEILLSEELSRSLGAPPGTKVTLIGTTMDGSMAMTNFVVSGTIRFGIRAMDRTGVIADISDIRNALDMKDAAGEVLGFFPDGVYPMKKAEEMALAYNAQFSGRDDEFLPVMQTLRQQPGMEVMFNRLYSVSFLVILIFLVPMSLVLWNAGLIGTMRRHGEYGLRLAIGEDKGHVYRSMIGESLIVGVLGSIAGTFLGLALSYYLQVKGIDISSMLKNVNILMPTLLRSRITPLSFVIGFAPGLLATLIGTAIAGRAVYRRRTAQLFKELES